MKTDRVISDKVMWGCFVIIAVLLIYVIVGIHFFTETVNTETQGQSKVSVQEKLYNDDGLGMIISSGVLDRVERGYLQWKKDYPERAKRIVAATISYENRLIVFYKTE